MCERKDGKKRDIVFLVSPAHRKIGQTQSACNAGLLRCISRKSEAQEIAKNKRNVLMNNKKGSGRARAVFDYVSKMYESIKCLFNISIMARKILHI